MGLRFRKSVSIIPGVRLNFGKTGMSVSAGVPGFRKTFHTNGRVTTSVGIPGTGLYYVDTKNQRTQNSSRNTQTRQETSRQYSEPESYGNSEGGYSSPLQSDTSVYASNYYESNTSIEQNTVEQIDVNSLKSIHKTSDDSIDWTEVLVSPVAPDDSYNQQLWEYYHTLASKVLSGDIDTYLQLIYEVNPLDDLLMYGSNFEFGTDNPNKIEVEFNINTKALETAKKKLNNSDYNLLLQDYICSVCIRIARDMFALLPIRDTIIHAVLNDKTVISVDFDRQSLSKVKFGYIDPSETLTQFRHNMIFNENSGFLEVENIK